MFGLPLIVTEIAEVLIPSFVALTGLKGLVDTALSVRSERRMNVEAQGASVKSQKELSDLKLLSAKLDDMIREKETEIDKRKT